MIGSEAVGYALIVGGDVRVNDGWCNELLFSTALMKKIPYFLQIRLSSQIAQ